MSTPAAPDLIVSVSGIRGIVGQSLTPDAACRFAAALGTYLNGGRVVVSPRQPAERRMLRHAVLAGLTAAGCAVDDLGIAPTPTVGHRRPPARRGRRHPDHRQPQPGPVERAQAVRPGRGRPHAPTEGEQVQQLFEGGGVRYAAWDGIGARPRAAGRRTTAPRTA